MALKIFYEPETELLTLLWQSSQGEQLCQELGDDMVLIQDGSTGESLGLELWVYRRGDRRLLTVDEQVAADQLPDRSLRLQLCDVMDRLIQSTQGIQELGVELHYRYVQADRGLGLQAS